MTFWEFIQHKFEFGNRDFSEIKITYQQANSLVEEWQRLLFEKIKQENELKDFNFKKSMNYDEGEE